MTNSAADSRDARRALRSLLLLWAAFATHGSLYPWEFAWPVSLARGWAHMMHQPSWWTGNGDVVGNIVLFAPMGALAWALWCEPRPGRWLRALSWTMAGVAFAFALQVIQIFVPARDAQLSDVVWNSVGLGLGILASRCLPVAQLVRLGQQHVRVPIAMASFWVCLQWWPLSPTLNRGHIARSLHLLWDSPDWAAMTAVQAALSLAVLGLLLRNLRSRLAVVLGCALLAILGKLMTAGQDVTISQAVGLLAGIALTALFWRLSERRTAAFGATVAFLYFMVKTVRLLELQANEGLREWLPLLLRGSNGSDALAWGWIAYWLLAAMILFGVTRRAAEREAVRGDRSGHLSTGRAIRKA